MPTNLEIKARITSLNAAETICKSIGANYVGVINQTDTYFKVKEGRLKLREFGNGSAELIYYIREETGPQRISDYDLHVVNDPETLKSLLSRAFGLRSVVAKKRILYMYSDTRIHLDTIDRLGTFMEFEIPMDGNMDSAQKTLDFLTREFGIFQTELFLNSYVDLMEKPSTWEKSRFDVAKS